jgi:hypothetical protein
MSLPAALSYLADGRPEAMTEAVRLLTGAARDGDPEAHERLALLSAAGVGAPQDWERTFDLLALAAAGGSTRAQGQLAALAGARRIEDWLAPCRKRVLHPQPLIVAIDGFLSAPVCAWLIGLARGRTARAMTYGPDGVEPAPSRHRTNTALELAFAECDVVVMLVRARIAAAVGLTTAAFEATQLLNYTVGEAYHPHFDFLDPARPEVAARGQRIVTFLVYLNDAFEGGETDFPRAGVRHRGGTGGALYFANLDAAGAPDPRTLHAGLPPASGEKWLLSQWIRNQARV